MKFSAEGEGRIFFSVFLSLYLLRDFFFLILGKRGEVSKIAGTLLQTTHLLTVSEKENKQSDIITIKGADSFKCLLSSYKTVFKTFFDETAN